MKEQAILRLSLVRITGLFGMFDHSIKLNTDDRLTIIHGPNGIGKTVMLRMINALIRNDLKYFEAISFSSMELEFDGDFRLILSPIFVDYRRDLKLSLYRRSEQLHESIVESTQQERNLFPAASQAPLELLQDVFATSLAGPSIRRPEWIDEFCHRTRSYLIAAERLFYYDDSSKENAPIVASSQPSRIHYVEKCQEDFKSMMESEMIKYGVESQKLDSSFPRRLVSSNKPPYPDVEMKKRMAHLDQRTDNLQRLGILEEGPALPFAEIHEIDPAQARVMSLYLDDAAKKLGFLDDFAGRARTLIANVNQKYRHKRVRIDRDYGIIVESEQGQSIPLPALSSGEQQQLILQYDLLFRVQPNTIVLIDEPELSLHLTWQKRFVPDLLQIIKLSSFDAIIATHSPFIAETRNDLMVALAEGD